MLDRFKVPKEDIVKVDHESLQETVTQIFEKMGVLPEDAKEGASVLVSTDLRGVETHGVSNMLRSYVERYNAEFLYINDDAFMARPKKEILDFCEMHSEFKLPFWFQTRFENVDRISLEALKKVGCYRISFGIEHGNEGFRKKMLPVPIFIPCNAWTNN